MTPTQSSAAKAPTAPKKPVGEGGPSRFFARNGEVFMVSEAGGYCLSHADCERCLTHWRADDGREPWAQRMTEQMADELEAAMADAAEPKPQRIAA